MNRRRVAAARVLLALVLLAALLQWVDPRLLAAAAAGADPRWLALGLAAAVTANLASALRWQGLARWLGAGLGPHAAVGVYFRAVAVNALLPGAVVGGDLYRAHALQRRGLPAAEAALSVLVDRLGGFGVLVVLGLAGAAAGASGAEGARMLQALGLPPLGPAAWLALAGLALLLPLGLVRAVAAARAADDPAAAWPARIAGLARRPGVLRQLGRQALGSVVVQILSIGAFACGGMALGVVLPAWAWAVAAMPIFLVASLPLSPGGWGTREAAAVLVLGGFGVAAPAAMAVALLYGLAVLPQALAGALAWGIAIRAASGDAGPGLDLAPKP